MKRVLKVLGAVGLVGVVGYVLVSKSMVEAEAEQL